MTNATEKKIIAIDGDDAAQLKAVTGWVSRNGRFYGDNERAARYDGCTHKLCERCGVLVPRDGLTYCRPCLGTRDAERYAAMPRKEWDGVTPLVIHRTDTYFFDEDELDEYCAEHEVERADLPLVICEPNRPPAGERDGLVRRRATRRRRRVGHPCCDTRGRGAVEWTASRGPPYFMDGR